MQASRLSGLRVDYLRDQAELLRVNLAAWDGKTSLVTLTPPGKKVLAWDKSKCRPGQHRCSGARGCRVHWFSAAKWDADLTVRLGELLKVARERTRRRHGGKSQGGRTRLCLRGAEAGVFHPHIVFPQLTGLRWTRSAAPWSL